MPPSSHPYDGLPGGPMLNGIVNPLRLGDDDDIACEGDMYVMTAAAEALHGRKGVVVCVDVKVDGGYTDYVTVELWGGGVLHAWSALHFRKRSFR